MSKETTNDDVAEPTEDTTESGSILEKNVSRRTALISAGLIGSAAASQSAGAVDVEVNEPGAAGNDNPPAQGDNPAEVLSLTLESDDIIVDVDGSGDIEKDYLKNDSGGNMRFPSTDPEVLPGDRVSNIEPEDRLVTTRDTNFDVNSDHIFQAPVFDNATNLETYYPYGHAFGTETSSQPTDDLSQTLNPAIGIKVDSIGIGQNNKQVSSISFGPPGSGTFSDRVPDNVDYSDPSIPGDGFSYVPGSAEFSFADHRQEVTLPNVANNGELKAGEANQLGMQSDFGSLGDGPEGIFFEVDPDTESDFFVIGDNTIPDVEDQSPDTTHTGTATFVSAEARENLEANGGTTFRQQSASIVTSIIDLADNPSEPALIKGQVTDGGSPQDGVDVEVTDARGTTQTATTDGDGRYQVTVEGGDTPDAPYEVEAQSGFGDGGSTSSPDDPVTVSPDEGETTVVDFTADSFDITPADGRTDRALIRGQVVDAVGDPVSIDVEVTPDGGSGTTETVTTDDDGRYRVSVNRDGNNPFQVEAQSGFGDGGPTPDDPVTVFLGGGQTAVVDFTPETFDLTEPTNIIRGQLVDQFGTPQDGVDVEVTDARGTTQTVTTDGDGRYQVPVFHRNADFEVAPQGDFTGFTPTVSTSDFGGSRGEIAVVDFKEGVGPEKPEPDTADENLVVRLPVESGDNVNQADDLEQGDPLGINRDSTGTGFTQTDDFTMLSTGSIIAGSSVESQLDDEGVASAFVEANSSSSGDFFLEVVTDQQTKNQLTGTLPDSLTVEQLTLEDVDDEATTDPILLDSRDKILTQLEESINAATRDGANDVVVQDVDAVENINDDDGDIDGIVIRSGTEVNDAYDQSVAVSSVEISSLPGSAGNRGLFGSGSGTAHPETTDIVTDLGLRDGEFNVVNADTLNENDIYKAQADSIDAAAQDSAENEQLGDFEVTNNGISEGEDATERVESKEETRTNDLVYRDSLNSSAGSAQDLGPTGSSNESTAGRFGPNPSVTQFHDGFDILELREPVEETADADVPHNPRGLRPGETNIDVYYGDRFDGIRVRNEGNLEGDNIENVQLGVMEPGESNNIDGEMWTVEKQVGDSGFDAQDTIYWFSREDLAEVSNLLDFVYFGDNTEDDNGSFEEEAPDELVNENVTVDHTSELTVSINVVNANEVGSPDQFGDTALFEVMDLEETTSQVDGEFDTFTGDSDTSAESGLFFKGHGDRGDIAASDGVTGGANQVRLANLYDPNNSNVPVEYVYGDGSIDTQGLLDAIRDFRDNNIDTQRLLEAITKFR